MLVSSASGVCTWAEPLESLIVRPSQPQTTTNQTTPNRVLTQMDIDDSESTSPIVSPTRCIRRDSAYTPKVQQRQEEGEGEGYVLHIFGEKRYFQIRGEAHPVLLGAFFFSIMGCLAALFPNSAANDLTVCVAFVVTHVGGSVNEALSAGHLWVLGRNAKEIRSEKELEHCVLIPTSMAAPKVLQSSIDVSRFILKQHTEAIKVLSTRLTSLPPSPSPAITSIFAYLQAADYQNAVRALVRAWNKE